MTESAAAFRSPSTAAPEAKARLRSGWLHVLAAVGLVLLGGLAVHDVWSDLAFRALNDEEASHILLVPLIVVWLVWARRHRFSQFVVRNRWIGPVIAAAAWAAYSVGDSRHIWSLWQVSAVLMLVGCTLSVLGTDVMRRFAPAVLVLAFLVPTPNRARQAITLPMQNAAATVTEGVLTTVGTGVERQGNLLSINGVEVTVAEACNGLRMTHALLLVAVAFVFASPFRPWMRVVLLLASPFFAIFCNILRLVPTVWVYGFASASAADAFHDMAGWVMLFVGYGLLTGFAWFLDWLGLPIFKERGVETAGAAAMAKTASPLRRGAFAAILAPVLLTGGVLAGVSFERTLWMTKPANVEQFHANIQSAAARLPLQVDGWMGHDVPVPTQAEQLLQPVTLLSRQFEHLISGSRIGWMIVHCSDNRDLLGHFPPVCYRNRGWDMLSADRQTWVVDDFTFHGVRYVFRPPGMREEQAPVTILNFMMVPGIGTVADMNALERATTQRNQSHYGAGQAQLLFYAGEDEETQFRVLEQLVRKSSPLISAMLADPSVGTM